MSTSVVNIYVDSLFEVALENNISENIHNQINLINSLFSENIEYIKLLSSPIISYKQKISILDNTFNSNIDNYLLNFLKILIKNNRLNIFNKIVKGFNISYNKHHNIVDVKVITAKPLNDNLILKLKNKLSSLMCKNILIENIIKEDIIAGIIIEIQNSVLDASLKSKLNALKSSLQNNFFINSL